jgi:non-ribosomal peptide synthetase-like protein
MRCTQRIDRAYHARVHLFVTVFMLDMQTREGTDAQPTPDAAPGCLHQLFEAQVDAAPGAIAIVCDEKSWSYAEIEARANRLMHYLRACGAGRGKLVGLAFERSELPIIAILACLKAGAAYVPIDPGHPDERIRYIVEEAELGLLLSEQSLADRLRRAFTGTIISLDSDAGAIAAEPATRLTRAASGLESDDLCYVIYTSGTTGRPKGVMTEHGNAVHFVLAFNEFCATTPQDRIYQGFSLGFDGSIEEIWMAFSNGAALVVGTRDTPRFGNDLARYLAKQGVTYFSTVPTMLSTITEAIPSLRQLVVAGEVCPPELVARWAQSGRLMLNAYGPTEATVNATAAVCQPGRPVTIGRPLGGYEALILDAEMRELPRGAKGELYIGGPGVARGYVKQPELTARHFVTAGGRRLYRTGDLASIDDAGELSFFGRADDQVKIRGYRVELSEIGAVLLEQPAISSATVRMHEHDGTFSLAAYVVLDDVAAPLDRGVVLAALRAKLPAYMIPAYLDVLDEMPMLSTGKVDRKRLPPPRQRLADAAGVGELPATPLETAIAEIWAALFKVERVGAEQDFFLDLGGHSLLAAQMVTLLRNRANVHIPVRDVYSFPTVRKLAAHVAAQAKAEAKPAKPDSAIVPANALRKVGFGFALAQGLSIVVLSLVLTLPLLVVIPVADDLLRGRIDLVDAAAILIPFGLALWIVMLLVSIAAKWLIIGRYRAGAYPLWGSYYFRFWLVSRLQGLGGIGAITGTPLMPLYLRLMGAKVGRDCAIESALCFAYDLISIGEDSSIGGDTHFLGFRVENGHLILGRIDIGNRCFVGSHSALGLNVRMEDGSRLDDQTLLADGETVPAGQARLGSPARPGDVSVPEGAPLRHGATRKVLFTTLAMLTTYLLTVASAAPGIAILLGWIWAFQTGWLVVAIAATAAALPLFFVTTCLWIAMLKAIILRRARAGTYPLYSLYYGRYWTAYGLMRLSRVILLPLFTTLYLPPWMRLVGAKLGRHVEMSTVWSFMPELIDARDGSFFADGCLLGGRRTFGGRWDIDVHLIGERSFVGNGAMLPNGASLGDGCLLGVLSTPPQRGEPTPAGTDWLGSPGFRLPVRQKLGDFSDEQTFHPTRKLYLQRGLVDACRILIPSYTAFALGLAGIVAALTVYEVYGLWPMIGGAAALGWLFAALAVLIVVALKWTVMGRFKPVIVPLWSPYVWFNEMVNGAYESLMSPVVSMFFGTPFAAPILRLLGCKFGRHCYIGSALMSEFDLIDVGDYVSLNSAAVVQNHLFEDRVMKSSYLRVADGCTIGNMSIVLYDTRMEEGAVLGPLSLLMKGEVQPAGARWHGIPTVEG